VSTWRGGVKPYEVRATLEKCDLLRPWQREGPIKRYDWAVEGMISGYISRTYLTREVNRFLKVAEGLIAEQSVLAIWRWMSEQANRPLTEAERKRRQEWLEAEALRATQAELRRQRKRLREGHATLTAIRKVLAHGARSSLVLASEPETSSPTS
jgi:hypothetical protein